MSCAQDKLEYFGREKWGAVHAGGGRMVGDRADLWEVGNGLRGYTSGRGDTWPLPPEAARPSTARWPAASANVNPASVYMREL